MIMKFLFAFFLIVSLSAGAQMRVPVFVSGEEGHQSYRIPAIIRL
jgi:sialidase-1